MKNLLAIQNVSLTYHSQNGETLALKDLNLSVNSGEIVSVIGPSGCGKSTLLSLISGLLKPSSGTVTLDGKSPDPSEGNVGYMLQKDQLFPWRTIEKNVFLPLEIKKKKDGENVAYGERLLQKYGLKDFSKKYPFELSGGMRQRVALIRTLVFKPKLLLLDEPFSALDYQTRLNVADDVYGILRAERCTAILVTHDISEAVSLSDRIVVLSPRPSKVKSEYTLGYDNVSPLKRRESPTFSEWFEILYKDLKTNEESC